MRKTSVPLLLKAIILYYIVLDLVVSYILEIIIGLGLGVFCQYKGSFVLILMELCASTYVQMLLFLGHGITKPKMAQSVRSLFMSRAVSYFWCQCNIIDTLHKYVFFHFFVTWFHDSIFPIYLNWKWIIKTKVTLKRMHGPGYCVNHPSMLIAKKCLKNVTPSSFGV